MPTYAFQCTQCGHEFSAKLPFGSKDYPPCEKCAAAVKKIMSPPLGIMFKGRGFYKTDGQKLPSSSRSSGSKTAADQGASKSETKSNDAKPAKQENKSTDTAHNTSPSHDAKK